MLLSLYMTWQVLGRLPPGPLLYWAAMIMGFSIGTIASAFNGCTFSTTFGLTFWLLNAALYQAFDVHLQSLRQRRPVVRPPRPALSPAGMTRSAP